MPRAAKSKDRRKSPKTVRLEYDFAGIKAGSMMFVATPEIIEAYIRAIPYGENRTIKAMRRHIAQANRCDDTCPVSTAIFLRLVAQTVVDALNEGALLAEVAPVWRVLTSQDKVSWKLSCEPYWLDEQRALEVEAVSKGAV